MTANIKMDINMVMDMDMNVYVHGHGQGNLYNHGHGYGLGNLSFSSGFFLHDCQFQNVYFPIMLIFKEQKENVSIALIFFPCGCKVTRTIF